jgi:hypothetical protein
LLIIIYFNIKDKILFINNSNEKIINIPKYITHLEISYDYKYKLPYSILSNIKEIKLTAHINNLGMYNNNIFEGYKYIEELFNYCYENNIRLVSFINNIDEILNEYISNDIYLNDNGTVNRELLTKKTKIHHSEIKQTDDQLFSYKYKLYENIDDVYKDKYIGLYINNKVIKFH